MGGERRREKDGFNFVNLGEIPKYEEVVAVMLSIHSIPMYNCMMVIDHLSCVIDSD